MAVDSFCNKLCFKMKHWKKGMPSQIGKFDLQMRFFGKTRLIDPKGSETQSKH